MSRRRLLLLRTVLGHRYQFAALSVIVTLGVAMFISLTVGFQNMESSYQRTYTDLGFADFAVTLRGAPEEASAAVGRLANVLGAEGRLILDTGLALTEKEQVHARLIGLPLERRPIVNNVLVESGTYWGPEESNGLLVESHFAKFHGVEAGDSLTFVTPSGKRGLQVLGVVASPEYLINAASQLDILPSPRRFGVFFLPLPYLQQLFGMEGQVNDIAVLVASESLRETTIKSVESVLRPYQIEQTVRREDQPSNAALQLDLDGAREFANLLPALVLMIAALSIFIALGRMVQAQRQHIGLFMALGWGPVQVLRHYLSYAIAIALVGSALGIALGLWLSSLLTDVYAETLGIPLVQGRFQPLPIVESVIVTVAVALVAGIGPAWRSSRMRPADAMRLDPNIVSVRGGVPLVERVLRLVVTPPMTLRIPLRAIFRSRLRTAYTVTGVSFAITLLLTAAANFDSIRHMIDLQYEQIERWDIAASLRLTSDESMVLEVASWPEVGPVEPFLNGFGTVEFEGQGVDVVVRALVTDTELHRFLLSDESRAALGAAEIVITPYVSGQLGADEGDDVTLATPFGQRKLTVSGVSQEAMGGGVYVALEEARELLGAPGMYNGLLIGAQPENVGDIRARLYGIAGVESVTVKENIVEDLGELLGLFYALAGVLLVFALIMSFAILFNTVTVNILERQRELATMRALGDGRGRLATMMLLENLLVGVGALLPGAALGTMVALYITRSFNSDLFTMQFYISPISYLAVAVGVLLTVALSVVPAIRRVNRMNLAEATKVLA